MSLRIVPTYSTDKGSDSLGAGFEEELGNDFFDQFLTFSPADNERPDFPELPDSTLQERSNCDSESAGTSSGSREDIPEDITTENATLSFTHDTDSFLHTPPRNRLYSESSGRAAISDSQLLSLEGITLQSPQIPDSFNDCIPASPTPVRRRHRLVDTISQSLRKVTGKSTIGPIRKQTASPTMMCSSRYTSQNDFDVWGQKLALDSSKLNFDLPQQHSPLSPPPSARVPSASGKLMMGGGEQYSDPFSCTQTFPQHYSVTRPAEYDTPLATPTLESHHSRTPSFQHTSSDNMLFPRTPQFSNPTNWGQDSSTSDFNTFGTHNTFTSETDTTPVWWNHAATVPVAQPSPTTFHSNPQRATKSLAVQLQNELAYNANELAMNHSGLATGLMIQMPETDPSQQSFVVTSPSAHTPRGAYFGSISTQPSQPFQTPSRQYAHTPTRQPYFTSPSIGHSRGRSISGSDSPSPKSTSSPSFHVRKRRTPSRKHEPLTPSLGGAVDFVNFTPHDSKKILTGVAPSGSSKTKARREKEALEKRRRLSQAAVRAVRAAGGSVESLVEEGLFV